MALTLVNTFQRSLNRQSILVTDLTGSGSTGYGGSNPAIGDFSAYNITITPADATTYAATGTPVTINAFPSLPSATDGTFTITSLALLGSADTVIPDGVYRFDIEGIYDDGGEQSVTATFYAVFYEITECCIQHMVADLPLEKCTADSAEGRLAAFAMLVLTNLRPVDFNGVSGPSYVVSNEMWVYAAEMLVFLNDICDSENCGCGC